MARELSLRGNVEALETIEIRSLVEGIVAEVLVDVGDEVQEGQLLLRLEQQEAQAELRRANAYVSRMEQQISRLRPLVERGATLPAELEDLEADLEVAKAEVSVWQTRVRLGEVRTRRPGTITARHVHRGNAVSSQGLLFELADMEALVVPLRVSEQDAVRLSPGDLVYLQADAFPEDRFEAPIRRIFPFADRESRRVIVEVDLAVAEAPVLRPGYLLRATLQRDRDSMGLLVPTESLLASEGEDQFLYVIEDDRLVRRPVERGPTRRNYTQVLSGLEIGEVVVAMNPTNLREGLAVRVTRWIE